MEEGTILFGNTPTTFMFFPLIGVVCIMAYTASYALRRYRVKQEIDLYVRSLKDSRGAKPVPASEVPQEIREKLNK